MLGKGAGTDRLGRMKIEPEGFVRSIGGTQANEIPDPG